MGAPKMPKVTPQAEAPNLLDPTVMFARQRERQKALSQSGRQSTILASGLGAMSSMKLGSTA